MKKGAKPVGIAHNPQLGTIALMSDGATLRLVTAQGGDGQHTAKGWEELPGFDVTPDDAAEPQA